VHIHSADAYAPVGILKIIKFHTEPKERHSAPPLRSPPLYTCPLPSMVCTGPISTVSIKQLPSCYCHGDHLFLSGFRGPLSLTSDNPISLQPLECLTAIKALLEMKGFSMDDVIFVHLYLSSMSDFALINSTYTDFFGQHPPSRSCVECPLGNTSQIMLDLFAVRNTGASMRSGDFNRRMVCCPYIHALLRVCSMFLVLSCLF
jgi:diphthine-ammonia ligase